MENIIRAYLFSFKSTEPIVLSGNSLFCMEDDDNRFQPMCVYDLSKGRCNYKADKALGGEECKSPFGTYELSIPVDEKSPCQGSSRFTNKNCKEFDVR